MKLAIPYEDGQIFQHFGKAPAFKIYDIADGKVGGALVLPTSGQGHGALAGLLGALGIDAVLCGGIGPGMLEALAERGIHPVPGITGEADTAAQAFAQGQLVPDPETLCRRHVSASGCGHHDCGSRQEGGCGGPCHEQGGPTRP